MLQNLEPNLKSSLELAGTILFAAAVLHTFVAGKLMSLAHKYKEGSLGSFVFHILGEVELVFGIWALIFLSFFASQAGPGPMLQYVGGLHMTEPLFVFCLMAVASTRPVLNFSRSLLKRLGEVLHRLTGLSEVQTDLWAVMTVGPLMGSFITEPAAITVTALLLHSMLKNGNEKLFYAMLATLFVNVSVGGGMTPYAAPPILMVAQKWGWDFSYLMAHFGFKVLGICVFNSVILGWMFRRDIQTDVRPLKSFANDFKKSPPWVIALHLGLLAWMVIWAHHPSGLFAVFLAFLALAYWMKEHHEKLRLKESLFVALFLAGLIVFGEFQTWWLEPILSTWNERSLFAGATALTAITDNAALTYLGSQVEGLSLSSKYYLVAGALAGGGLSIIANAPNVAGFSILQHKITGGLSAWKLFRAALIPTAVAVAFLIL